MIGGRVFGGGVFPYLQQGALLNKSYDPLADEGLTTFLNSRRDNILLDLDSVSGAEILTPCVYFTGSNSRFRILTSVIGIQGGAAWDVTFKFKLDDYTRRNPLFYNGGNSNSNKGLCLMPYNGNLVIYSSDGSTAYSTATIACGFQNNTDYTLRFEWNGITAGTMTITVNGTSYTTTTNKGWTGLPSESLTDFGGYASVFYFKGYYKSVVGTLGGVSLNFHPTGLNATNDYDLSQPGRRLTFSRYNGTTSYTGNSTYYIDYGYSVQKGRSSGLIVYYPNDINGDTVVMSDLYSGGLDIIQEVKGTVYHNLWLSRIKFVNTFFDRSNTTIWNETARTGFYDAANPRNFDISELNLLSLRGMLNDKYKGMIYLKFNNNSIDDRLLFKEVLLSTADRKGADELPILTYTNDVTRLQKYLNGDYYLDADGYLQLYLYSALGGNAEANYTYFQSLLDAGNATLAGKSYEVYAVSQPLKPKSGSIVTINCEVRSKPATITAITQNVTIGDTLYHVNSVAGFEVGAQIIMTDDVSRGTLTGGAERNFSNCGTILSIDVDNKTITVDEPAKYDLLVSQNAKLGHFNSVILIDNRDNITIKGNGVINGNKELQHLGEPVNAGSEEIRFGCGISIFESNDVIVDGTLEIKNASLHNIMAGTLAWPATKATGVQIKNVNAHSCRDKNILAVNTDGLYINNVNVHDAKYEDGIMLYLGNINYIIDGVICNDNPRNGVSALSGDSIDGLIKNVTLSDMMAISSSNTHLENIDINTGGLLIIESAYGAVENVTLDGVEMIGLSGTASIQLLGELDGITFNDLTINDSAASIAHIVATDRLSGGVYPQNVEFHNGGIFNSTGTPTAINAGADVTFNNFAGL